ncbi:hypothetical protein BH23PLA1_BH23PLA1_01870 [soil metagenome]
MQLVAAAIQMPAAPMRVVENLERADVLLRRAQQSGAELLVLPEMFNTGYGSSPDYAPVAEDLQGPTLRLLRERCREGNVAIAAGFVERCGSHIYDALAFCSPDGQVEIYRKRHLVFWECSKFRKGIEPLIVSTRWGRIGFAICADMIYRRVWRDYRDRIDLAIISAAWPDFADRRSGRPHWLLGRLGPLCGEIPRMVAQDLGIPVIFANQCGETETRVPAQPRILDRFAGRSSLCDGRHALPVKAGIEEAIVIAPLTLSPVRGSSQCHSMSPSASTGSSSMSPV